MKLTRFVYILCTAVILSSCASNVSEDDVGKVTHIRFVSLKNDREGEFMNGGAVSGQGAGNNVAGLIGIVAGAAIGAAADGIREENLKSYDAVEYTIAMKNGDTHEIVQQVHKEDQPFKVGDRVVIDTSCRNLCVLPYEGSL